MDLNGHTSKLPDLRINADRFSRDFNELARIGATDDGGVHRPALSPAHLDARNWFISRAAQDNLRTFIDPAGNHSALLEMPGAEKTLLLGSHLDSVPQGGRFDGSVGLLAALEVLRTIKESGLKLPVHLEAIDFTDEEGTLVNSLGSEALAGLLLEEKLQSPRGGRDRLVEGLERAGLHEADIFKAARSPESLAGYMELHIEQGPILERDGIPIGIVSGIVGSRSYHLRFHGVASHAGTTPMGERADAGLGAGAFNGRMHHLIREKYPGCVGTVGQMRFEPGAFNIIPGQSLFSLEIRSLDAGALERLECDIFEIGNAVALLYKLDFSIDPIGVWPAVPMDPVVMSLIDEASRTLKIETIILHSGAGHDAQSLAQVTPTGMIFIPSVGGISHSPDEFSNLKDCVNGANVLLHTVILMARQA